MAVTHQFYNDFISNLGNGTINLISDDIKVILVNGYVFDAIHTVLADVSGSEIPAGNGYETGGVTLVGSTLGWDLINAWTKWDADDVTWLASGGAIGPSTGAVFYSNTSDDLIGYIDFDASETATDTDQFKLTFNTNGVFTIS